MAVLDLLLILCYLLAMVGIGVYFSRKNKSSEQFTTASGSIPGWALGLSFYATFLSAITFLGDPGKSFGANWNPFVFSLSIPLAATVATVRGLVRHWRAARDRCADLVFTWGATLSGAFFSGVPTGNFTARWGAPHWAANQATTQPASDRHSAHKRAW